MLPLAISPRSNPQNPRKWLSSQRGFSLIEVVLAVGMTSLSLVTILALLPAGLSSLHESSRQVVETEIFNQMGAELAATPFPVTDGTNQQYTLDTFASTRPCPVYFDVEGLETTKSAAIYTVQCKVSGSGEIRYANVRIGFQKDPTLQDTAGYRADQRTFFLTNRTGF